MKYLLVVTAVLLALTMNVLAVPIDASSDSHCLGGQCVYVGDEGSAESQVIRENDVANLDGQGLGAVTSEHIVRNKGIVTKCEEGGDCPMSYHSVYRSEELCWCVWFPGQKADMGPAPQGKAVSLLHASSMKGKTWGGIVGMRERRTTRCRRGPSDKSLTAREEQEKSGPPQDPDALCTGTLKGRCANGSVGLWNKVKSSCECGPEPQKASYSANTPTTADMLTTRLLPQPLKFPTGISADDWVAIQATLVLLEGYIASQADLHRVCTGAEDPQVYGFKLDIFRTVCTPEIFVPAPKSEIVKAQKRILTALYIDTILERNNNDLGAACDDVRSPNTPDRGLDNEWIQSVLCSKAP